MARQARIWRICTDTKEEPQIAQIAQIFGSISREAAKGWNRTDLYRQELSHISIAIYVKHADNFFVKMQEIDRQ